jgi:hypothetical protein
VKAIWVLKSIFHLGLRMGVAGGVFHNRADVIAKVVSGLPVEAAAALLP